MRQVLVGVILCVGCGSDPPKPPVVVKTSTMAANITVVGDGTKTTADIVILSGDTLMDHFALGMGDTLTASKPGASKPMAAMGMAASLLYEASFDGMDAAETVYTIAFARTADMGAPNSTATMPAPLSISLPADGASYSRTMDDIVVNYAPNGSTDPITWNIQGGCAQVAGAQPVTGDSGNFTIGRNGIHNAGAGGTCDLVLTLYRTRMGKLDPAFAKGGKVVAQQIAKVTISSKP